MSHAMKAALLSGLVFPGLGQIILKKYTRGITLGVVTFVLTALVVAVAVNQALRILDRIVVEGGAIDMGTVSDIAVRSAAPSSSLMINLCLLLMTGCWIFGIVDAYLLGKKKDLMQQARFVIPEDGRDSKPG